MRKTLVFIMLLTGLILAACEQKTPKIRLETERIEFGDVINGIILTKDVLVHNDGDAPLIVKAVSTSCGCTSATLETKTIQPGATGVLHIEFDSGAHGPELTGELIRQVFIASNDPRETETILELSANILPPAE